MNLTVVTAKKERMNLNDEVLKHRMNMKEILQNSNATIIRCHGDIGYACFFCSEQCPDPADLKKHNIECHKLVDTHMVELIVQRDLHKLCNKLDITNLTCQICLQNIDTFEELILHLKKNHTKETFPDIKHHILPFKFDSDCLRCYVCLNVFNKFKPLLEHMNIHYRNYICDVCDAGFVNKKKLYFHRTSHRLGTYNCNRCPKVFNTFTKKRSHEKVFHDKSLVNKCGYCNAVFKSNRQKDKHLVIQHGASSFARKCQACDKTFVHQNALMIHMKRHHLVERSHKCKECGKDFFSSTELKGHMIKHSGKKEFQCEVCLKSYARKWTLREHMRIHADDRRYKCEHCSQTFVQKCSWRGHMRNKHGEQA